MKIGIVYATRREAAPFLAQSASRPLVDQPFACFESGRAWPVKTIALISGMGKVAAAMAATHLVLVHRVSLLVSAGLCGRLVARAGTGVGDCFRISTAVEGDCDRFGRPAEAVTCDPRLFGRLETARLVTCDRPVFENARRARLATIGDLADMEGAAVARVAMLSGITCAMVKGISDGADASGRRDLAANIDWVSQRIADVLIQEMSTLTLEEQPC